MKNFSTTVGSRNLTKSFQMQNLKTQDVSVPYSQNFFSPNMKNSVKNPLNTSQTQMMQQISKHMKNKSLDKSTFYLQDQLSTYRQKSNIMRDAQSPKSILNANSKSRNPISNLAPKNTLFTTEKIPLSYNIQKINSPSANKFLSSNIKLKQHIIPEKFVFNNKIIRHSKQNSKGVLDNLKINNDNNSTMPSSIKDANSKTSSKKANNSNIGMSPIKPTILINKIQVSNNYVQTNQNTTSSNNNNLSINYKYNNLTNSSHNFNNKQIKYEKSRKLSYDTTYKLI